MPKKLGPKAASHNVPKSTGGLGGLVPDGEFEIIKVYAREILDSRGNPTVEVDVLTKGGSGRASVPSGASTGAYEALELRDGDELRFHGKGVLQACRNVNEEIAPRLLGRDCREQRAMDMLMIELDGTENKSRLGANAILGTSLAIAKAAADTMRIPLFKYLGGDEARVMPVPLMNVINGGKHAGNELSFQEFMVVPVGAESLKEALRLCAEIYSSLREYLRDRYGRSAINVGDEGGFAPPMKMVREALQALDEAIRLAGYRPGVDASLAIDVASSELYDEGSGTYLIDGKRLSMEELAELYEEIIDEYPIISIEDPFHEDDFEGTAHLTKEIGSKVQVVGDDLFATNIRRLRKGIEHGAANAMLLKVNQIGTLTEALDAAHSALRHGYRVIVSHRSGETEDTAISDLAVALSCGQIKAGAPARGERTAKYNQLLRIEEILGERARYLGSKAFKVDARSAPFYNARSRLKISN